MDGHDVKAKDRRVHAVEVLRRLDGIGAIKLDVLLSKSAEIQSIAAGSASIDDEDRRICYPFYIHFGPRDELDLVSVATQLRQLGFNVTPNTQIKG
jgi:hypothetical protein